jgi:hypothetical protein
MLFTQYTSGIMRWKGFIALSSAAGKKKNRRLGLSGIVLGL